MWDFFKSLVFSGFGVDVWQLKWSVPSPQKFIIIIFLKTFLASGLCLKIVLALLRNFTPVLQDLWARPAILPQQNPVVYFKALPGPLHTAVAWSRSTLAGPKQIKWVQAKSVQKRVSPLFSGEGLDRACFLSSSFLLSYFVSRCLRKTRRSLRVPIHLALGFYNVHTRSHRSTTMVVLFGPFPASLSVFPFSTQTCFMTYFAEVKQYFTSQQVSSVGYLCSALLSLTQWPFQGNRM